MRKQFVLGLTLLLVLAVTDGDCAPGFTCFGGQCCDHCGGPLGTSCTGDGDCQAGLFCGADHVCLTQKAQGRACEPAAELRSLRARAAR